MYSAGRGIHRLGQPRKPGQTHPKKKGWVGLCNWVSMISKNEKPIKINGFRVNQAQTQKLTYPIMLIFFIFIFTW